ncbi:MAG: flagellar export chaperone FlgN [Armatimonadota bacterium]
MTADTLSSMLNAELEAGELLAEALDCQRRALIERDLDRISRITGVLEGQMEHFTALVERRIKAVEAAGGALNEDCAELLERIRRTERRVLRLAELNQELIADRLAYVGAMLSTIGMTGPAGYGADTASATVSRSA